VIEDDVEDHFQSRAVKRFDHIPKLIEDCERVLLGTVRVMWRKE
jgi:hypothetical protein